MSIKSIEQEFIDKVSTKVRVLPDGRDRFRVFTLSGLTTVIT